VPRREVHHPSGLPSVHLAFTDAGDGDLAVGASGPGLDARRHRVAPHPWTWLQQVHGARVVEVDEPGEWAGAEADAAVTTAVGAVLAVHTADCAGVLLFGSGPDPVTGEPIAVVGAAHAGWRGLADGILQHTVDLMRRLGAEDVRWDLGPCISPAAYEFGEDDLATLADRYGPAVRSHTLDGAPALDLRAGVRAALAEAGVDPGAGPDHVPCTALDPGFFSWRARRDSARQAAAVWLAPPDEGYPWHP
jgi:purine-nucleoside/S-methyl-5'-thioadenosine phosphorylase / adenosine deaminase